MTNVFIIDFFFFQAEDGIRDYKVTGVQTCALPIFDADAAVFPYLQLHAQRNGVSITTRQGAFADLAPQKLAAFDLIVGAEICFWEELVAPLYQLVRHDVAAGVAEILVADPGPPPFDELCVQCLQQGDAEVLAWVT